jgi:hypothetical protein
LLVLSDQAVSSLSNVLVTILVASTANRQTFGVFALTLVAYQLALGAIRSVATEPLLSLYADHGPRSRRGIVADIQGTTLFVGAACSLLTCAVAALLDPGPQAAFLALALVLPLVLVQDTWRYLLVIDRPGAALAIDVVWLLVLVPALTLVPSGSEAGTYVLAWGLTGALGAVMSGSGPTMLGLCRDEEHATQVARAARAAFARVEVTRGPVPGVTFG